MILLDGIEQLREHGFAIHWLHDREKRPIGNDWSDAPVATMSQLRSTYRSGNNVGVRLGEPSRVGGGYLHVVDLDIRLADLRDETWAALKSLLTDVDISSLPCVASGSGGESRHLYFITQTAFRSKKLATSEGKHRTPDGKWSYDWEIELFGTGKQVVLPPSIHPISGQPYQWLQTFDFDLINYGLTEWPCINATTIERLSVAEHTTYEFETREPLTFISGQLQRLLDDVGVARIDDYHDWITLGQAIHHQYGGSSEGFDTWLAVSARSPKFETTDKRELLRKWRGFGRSRRKPVTMATIVEWVRDARVAALRDSFDEEDPTHGAALPAAAATVDAIDGIGTAPAERTSLDWVSLLEITEEGAIKGTLHNVEMIVRNDSRLVGVPQINQFTQETVQRLPPGSKPNRRANAAKDTRQLTGPVWQVKNTLDGELWSDDRDFAVRSILEAPKTQGGYGIKISDRDLKAAIVLAANDHAFHPVREYLLGQTWDGVHRVDTMFMDYVGAPDDPYSRSVSRLLLTAAVTRIFEPGHKYDFAVILEGLQGKRKSTFIRVLGRSWFAELDGDFHDAKQMVELMQNAWIMEIPELSGFGRADVRSIKAFISRQTDRARLAYARRAGEFPRQCVFIGSTNDREYLKDDTGGRRFLPMKCEAETIDIARLEQNVDQLWAEAVTIYREMRAAQPLGELPLYITDTDAQGIAERLQESRRVESSDDGVAGRIADWLAQPINTGSIVDDTDELGQPIYRDKTCLLELWVDCLGGDLRGFEPAKAATLGRSMKLVRNWENEGTQHRFKRWGKQRVYSYRPESQL